MELGTPPPAPPRLLLSGAGPLSAIDWEWFDQNGWDEGSHTDDTAWNALPRRDFDDEVRFELETAEPPAELIAVTYRHRLDSAGPPAAESGHEETCSVHGSVCRMDAEHAAGGTLRLRPRAEPITKDFVVILHAQWPVATGEEVVLNTAAYGFKATIRR